MLGLSTQPTRWGARRGEREKVPIVTSNSQAGAPILSKTHQACAVNLSIPGIKPAHIIKPTRPTIAKPAFINANSLNRSLGIRIALSTSELHRRSQENGSL
jgi:hypothetical protein